VKLRQLTDTGEWTTRRYLSLLGTVLIWIIVAIDAWYLWPSQLGGHTSMVIVSGESMEPTYFDGDLVIARKMEPSIGDVIIYAPEGLGGSQIVHRIIGGNAEDGWELQGDNNDFVDPFTPKGDEVKGVVLVHYSNFGRVTVLLLNPMVWAFVLLAAIVLLLWWSDDCDDDDEDDADDRADGDAGGDSSTDAVLDPGTVQDVGTDQEGEPAPEPSGAKPVPVAPMTMWKRSTRRASAVFAATLVAAGVMAGPASASQLAINAPGAPFADSQSKCGALSLAATVSGTATAGNYTGVSVSGVSTACQGLPATVTLVNSSGSVIATGSVASTAPTTTFTTPSYSGAAVSKIVVKIDGWVFVPTWTPPTPPPVAATCVPTNSSGVPVTGTCTVTNVTITESWGEPGSRGANATFAVNSSSGYFRVTFNFSQAPFPGWSPRTISGNFTLPPVSNCSALPSVTLRGPDYSIWQPPTHNYYLGFSEDPGNICS
jgi:signal peptidase I